MRQNKRGGNVEGQEEETSEVDDMERPPYSYSELAAMAIRNSPEMRCTVQEICHFVEDRFPYYRNWDIKAAKANFASVLYQKSDFVRTTDYVRGKDGLRRHYYSFRPIARKKNTIKKRKV